jgi:hypothetical protein
MPASANTFPSEAAVIDKPSYIDWSGVFVGAIVASAISWLLLTFGSAIGLLAVSPYSLNSGSAATVTMAAAVWFALTQIYAIGMGAYIAARLRPRVGDGMEDEVRFRDGITGVTVWALAIILGLLVAGMAASSAARTGAAVVGNAAGAAGAAARQIDPAYTVDLLTRPAAAQNGQPGGAGTGQGREITESERGQIGRILANSLAQGSISEGDRQYLTQIVADRTGLPREEAERRITQTYDQAKAAALETADTVRKATSFAGFWIVFIMLAAGLTAWWGGTIGGHHRDEGSWY